MAVPRVPQGLASGYMHLSQNRSGTEATTHWNPRENRPAITTNVMMPNKVSAIVQNAEERENISLPAALGGRIRLVGARIISDENLAWELMFWAKDSFSGGAPGADLDLDTFLGKWLFTAGDGSQGYCLPAADQEFVGHLRVLFEGKIDLSGKADLRTH